MRRPIGRYHGGKWKLGKWIISHFPSEYKTYIEPFGGVWSVGFQAPRSYSEVYNDLDGEIVDLFRTLRDRHSEVVRAVELTPFAREEFELSYKKSSDSVEQARRTLFRLAAGHSTAGTAGRATGFRSNVKRSGSTPAGDWSNLPPIIQQAADRLRGVVIENMDAMDLIDKYTYAESFLYVDPPYVPSTRGESCRRSAYKHEMDEAQHVELANLLRNTKGRILVSGYRCELYDELYGQWDRFDKSAYADSAGKRTECLWANYNTMPLFDTVRYQN